MQTAKNMSLIKLGRRKKIPACVGMHSLVGVGGNFPLSFGNYFDFYDPTKTGHEAFVSCRCLNFWAENLEEAKVLFLHDNQVEVIYYPSEKNPGYGWAIVDDARIPDSWYNNKLCFTGTILPPAEYAKEIYEYLGDPTNEYEQFTDPKSYWEKRGWVWHGSWLSKQFKANSTPLKAGWSIEVK